jgi:hypothetical protein
MQIRVELWMTRASWDTGLPVSEDKNGSATGSADDDSLGMCAEMIVGHAGDSAVLKHTLEADMAAVLSWRQRSLCLGSHICLGASVHLFEGTGLGARRRNKTKCCLRCSVNALFDNRREERMRNFGASFLIPLSGFREGETFLNYKLLDALLFEKNQAFF